jgi:hypothetical protein
MIPISHVRYQRTRPRVRQRSVYANFLQSQPLYLSLLYVSGEEQHAKGQDGARRAKLWLEATTRADVPWVNPDPIAVKKLTFTWIDGTSFSYDLGGMLRGGDLSGEEFLAESKNYKSAQDQNKQYDEYLAKCYVAYGLRPDRCNNFMWITWSAFATTTWDKLLTSNRVRAAVIGNSRRALGVAKAEAPDKVDVARCNDVAERLWMIVLSKRQEKHLVLTLRSISA